ncbi:tail fiber protein [Colwellia sp. E2M01]|nr:tail fiber protein [Colwellia sp. E2M01]
MSEPFLSEIKIFGFDWPPRNWAKCDGQIIPINQNQSLYALLGSTYGGDGRTNFALPDLRGRTPMHAIGGATKLGERGGAESVTLTEAELPNHQHFVNATGENANTATFSGNIIAAGFDDRDNKKTPINMYAPAENLVALNPHSISAAGASRPHNNQQPSCVVNFCISLQGLFPARN